MSEIEDEYIRFRREHRLARSPQIPRYSIQWAFGLGIIVIIEGFLNGSAFSYISQGEDILNAYIGGGLVSLSIVLLGVVTGFVGLRHLGYRAREQPIAEKFWRSAGTMIAAVAIGMVVAIILIVCITRINFSMANAVAAQINASRAPYVIQEHVVSPIVFAIAFAGLSVFTYLFSILKAYEEFSDPFPGYSKAYSRRRRARKRYEGEKRKLFDQIREKYRSSLSELGGDLEGQRDQLTEMRALDAETSAWDSSARQEPDRVWIWILSQYGAFDEGYAAVVADRREKVPDPPKPTEFIFDPKPDFANDIRAAEEQLAENQRAHQSAIVEFAEEMDRALDVLVKTVEDWPQTFANRNRPYGGWATKLDEPST